MLIEIFLKHILLTIARPIHTVFKIFYHMVASKKEEVDRLTIKIPKSIAAYFRKAFPHGARSKFVAKCILDHQHGEKVKTMEKALRQVGMSRQS